MKRCLLFFLFFFVAALASASSGASALGLFGDSELLITDGQRIVGKATMREGRWSLELSAGFSGPAQVLAYGAGGSVSSFEALIAPGGKITLMLETGAFDLLELLGEAGLEPSLSFVSPAAVAANDAVVPTAKTELLVVEPTPIPAAETQKKGGVPARPPLLPPGKKGAAGKEADEEKERKSAAPARAPELPLRLP